MGPKMFAFFEKHINELSYNGSRRDIEMRVGRMMKPGVMKMA